jgi:hypothetical protein
VHEVVSFAFISSEAARVDSHPVVISTDDAVFAEQQSGRARRAGRAIWERFVRLVNETLPSYAAVTVEYGLECLADLATDSRSLAFSDFFVNARLVGTGALEAIRANAPKKAYIRSSAQGLFVSCTRFFNPLAEDAAPEKAQWFSVKVAKIIVASALKQKKV